MIAARAHIEKTWAIAEVFDRLRPLPDAEVSGREGQSLGNVSRGDRTPIELFLEGLANCDSKTLCFTER